MSDICLKIPSNIINTIRLPPDTLGSVRKSSDQSNLKKSTPH